MLGHDLIGGVHRVLRTPDARDRLHLLHRLEQFHADHRGAQPEMLVQAVHEGGVVVCRVGHHGLQDLGRTIWVWVTMAASLPSSRLILVCHTMVVRPR